MTDLAIITPTRGRPERVREMIDAARGNAVGPVHIWLGIDRDDPLGDETIAATLDTSAIRDERRSLSAWTNHLARMALDSPDPPRYLASLGDDHRPRTPGWDQRLIDAIEAGGGSGFAYGNDLLQGQAMPTAWVVSADIVQTLGWMMLPGCAHMYVDAAILDLGLRARCITYRPDVIVEHVHPLAGKTGWDASYRETNTEARYAADRAAYEEWLGGGLEQDAAKIRALAGAVA